MRTWPPSLIAERSFSFTYTATGSLNLPSCCILYIKSPPFTYSITKYSRSWNEEKNKVITLPIFRSAWALLKMSPTEERTELFRSLLNRSRLNGTQIIIRNKAPNHSDTSTSSSSCVRHWSAECAECQQESPSPRREPPNFVHPLEMGFRFYLHERGR